MSRAWATTAEDRAVSEPDSAESSRGGLGSVRKLARSARLCRAERGPVTRVSLTDPVANSRPRDSTDSALRPAPRTLVSDPDGGIVRENGPGKPTPRGLRGLSGVTGASPRWNSVVACTHGAGAPLGNALIAFGLTVCDRDGESDYGKVITDSFWGVCLLSGNHS